MTYLKKWRKKRKMSIPELSQKSGVSIKMINKIEEEDYQAPIRILELFARALQVPMSALEEPESYEPFERLKDIWS